MPTMTTIWRSLACMAPLVSPCCAQEAVFSFVFPNGAVFDGSSAVEVELWASFNPTLLAFGSYKGGIEGSDPTGEWTGFGSAFTFPFALGTPQQGSVHGIYVLNPLAPPTLPNTANPILVWHGAWSSPDLKSRTVQLDSETLLPIAWTQTGLPFNLIPFEEASAQIQVVPAPGPAVVILGAIAVAARRKR